MPEEVTSETLEHDLTLIGLVGMIDPPREEAKQAVAVCRQAGIKPIMITGDHVLTASAIAQQLGIMEPGDRAVTGSELAKLSEEELDQVQLMTLHASKGLEFPYVYMVGMEEGFLPHQSSIDEDNIDEERRLAYVGITRAQKELTFTLCKERRQYGELVRPEPSRFLLELPQDDLIWEQERKVVSAEERMQKGQSHLANLKAMMAAKRGK